MESQSLESIVICTSKTWSWGKRSSIFNSLWLIFFAIQNKNWNIARENITGLIGANPTREICLFMSDIELGENNDKQKSDSWLLRSENSLVENVWICEITNQSQYEWNSLSDSGYFNSLVLYNPKIIDRITN